LQQLLVNNRLVGVVVNGL